MSNETELFGKTFDQQVGAAGGDLHATNFTPNRRVAAQIVFESIGPRVQVTAYDEENHVLFRSDEKRTEESLAPRRIRGEVVFEPVGRGVRVTARDEAHQLLWGYIGSLETVEQIHCLVATYDTLQGLVVEELKRGGRLVPETVDPLETAQAAVATLQETVQWLKNGLDVKKVSDATLQRARVIARIATDANRQLTLEAGSLKGMKSKAAPEDASNVQ